MLFVEHSSEFILGYAVGLIVGEGSFTGHGSDACLAVKLHRRDPKPLRSLQSAFGGKIYGPYCHGGREYRTWVLRGDDLYDALPIISQWLPDSHKRIQMEEWAKKFGFLCRRRAYKGLSVGVDGDG